jgi:hypothetical protein
MKIHKNRTVGKYSCFSHPGEQSDNVIDMYSITRKGNNTRPLKKSTASVVTETMNASTIGNWLALAAEQYKISPKLEDYICVPVIIMPSDLPNRNGVAFPYHALTSFNPNPHVKRVAYQTWEGAPTFYEHANEDYEKAKGVVFATSMSPIKNSVGNLYKLTTLCGFDRTKDTQLYNRILRGDLTTYSMGAYVDDYVCSICGTSFEAGGCNHVDINNPSFTVFDTKHGKKLGYYETVNVCGFEVSAVETPAYVSAQNEYLLKLS